MIATGAEPILPPLPGVEAQGVHCLRTVEDGIALKARSKEAERRRDLELVRRRTQRMIRESGYLREADIAGRLAAQLTETQMELRSQAQSLAAANATSLETAVQQYAAEAASAGAETAAPAATISVQG